MDTSLHLTRDLEPSTIEKGRIEGREDEAATEANEAIDASSQGRSRCLAAYEYGPPLFQIGDMVKIMKDTTPGVH